MSAEFEAAVSEWATSYYGVSLTIDSVDAMGLDWNGSTEGGFYESFEVSLRGRRNDNGEAFFRDVKGKDLESLWKFVVAGFRQAPGE